MILQLDIWVDVDHEPGDSYRIVLSTLKNGFLYPSEIEHLDKMIYNSPFDFSKYREMRIVVDFQRNDQSLAPPFIITRVRVFVQDADSEHLEFEETDSKKLNT